VVWVVATVGVGVAGRGRGLGPHLNKVNDSRIHAAA
jgi:hypothetical protein